MKKINILFYINIFILLGSCLKEDSNELILDPMPTGLYGSMVYKETDIVVNEITYTTRPNFQNLQYTSEKTKQFEINQPLLSAKMDLYLPPNANPSKKQPLLIMIHGGGYESGDKKAWENEAYTYSRAGYICASLNYRLTQNGGNQTPELRLYTVQCALEDIQNGIRFLKKNSDIYYIDTTRTIVFGGSAGGGLSLTNAIEYDAVIGINDHPGISSKTEGSISTGATLINDDPASMQTTLHYDRFDSPVLLFHAKENDSSTGATWTKNVISTQELINNSGNLCITVAQPNMTHIVGLELGGNYWHYIQPFLWTYLKIDKL
ncbi:alpha/beta hydrolase [Flavobacterium oreochromis]|uniref:BD-FAE-like domain-containing protein n=1 Tax=Flavobacterium columnare TaxID=996 RepID=A0A246G9I8_9FLAO|nr:alpha/beta hydrolase [Flavobacterium oreochromis]OWP76246.1 hypothetical protein BWK62_10240 [Flavobacterium oreochromis]